MRFLFLLLPFLAVSTPVAAQELLERYVAELSAQDHYNSKGKRLQYPWQIIRQDRANFHRFGKRDPADEWDSFFGSIENRAIAERMVENGYIAPGVSDLIVNNEVIVEVEIWGGNGRGQYLNITAY